MLELSQFINSLDPWWVVFFALVLIGIDWLLLNNEAFLIIGVATLKLSAVLFLKIDFELSAWLVPLFLFTSFGFQRHIFRPLISSRQPDEIIKVVGMKGKISKSSDKNESADVFFQYEVSIEGSKKPTIETASIRLEDGRRFTVENAQDVKDGAVARIIKHSNGIVSVREE